MRSLIGRRLITSATAAVAAEDDGVAKGAAGLIAKFSTSIFRQAARCRAISRLPVVRIKRECSFKLGKSAPGNTKYFIRD